MSKYGESRWLVWTFPRYNTITYSFVPVQGMFVRVNADQTALQMRKDLRHWRHAAELASHCAPQEVTGLQQQHAEGLEIQGDISAAHAMFQVLVHLSCRQTG